MTTSNSPLHERAYLRESPHSSPSLGGTPTPSPKPPAPNPKLSTSSSTYPALSLGEKFYRWRNRESNRHAIEAWVILTPILIYYFVFNVVPILLNIVTSFTEWRGVINAPKFVGLDNYVRYLRAPYPLIIFNTVFFAIVTLVVQTVLAFFIAILLNKKLWGRGVHRALWYIPTLTSAAIMAQIAFIFISPYDGVLNSMLTRIFDMGPVIWPLKGAAMRLFIILFQVWRGVGVPMVLFLAALQGIHRELYDAASVDGATGTQMLRFVTVPLLRPMIVFILVTGIINGFQIFEASLLITKGGPSNMTNVMLLQIYNDAFTNFNLGVASAGTVIMAVMLLWFSITGIRLMSQEDND